MNRGMELTRNLLRFAFAGLDEVEIPRECASPLI